MSDLRERLTDADSMPIMWKGSTEKWHLPMRLFRPHEKQAWENHGQTLDRLRERGGLDPDEATAILQDRPFKNSGSWATALTGLVAHVVSALAPLVEPTELLDSLREHYRHLATGPEFQGVRDGYQLAIHDVYRRLNGVSALAPLVEPLKRCESCRNTTITGSPCRFCLEDTIADLSQQVAKLRRFNIETGLQIGQILGPEHDGIPMREAISLLAQRLSQPAVSALAALPGEPEPLHKPTLERAIEVVTAERLEDPQPDTSDEAYERALTDAISALEQLRDDAEGSNG